MRRKTNWEKGIDEFSRKCMGKQTKQSEKTWENQKSIGNKWEKNMGRYGSKFEKHWETIGNQMVELWVIKKWEVNDLLASWFEATIGD